MPVPVSHMEKLNYTLPATVLADGRSYIFKACYEDLVRQPLIDLSGSCADKSSPFENIPNLLCIWTGEEANDKKQTLQMIKAVPPEELLQIREEKKCRNLLCFKLSSSKTMCPMLLHMHHSCSLTTH